MDTNNKHAGNGRNQGGKVRYAVVGLGHISQVAALPAFAHADNAELVALVSGSGEKRDQLARHYGVEHVVDYDGYDDLLRRGIVDAVYIGLPNHQHCDYTVRAARAGVHVLCEKPMAVTEDECQQMIDACNDAGAQLMIAYRLHFEQANLEALELVRRGDLGEVRIFDSVFSQQVEEGDIRLNPIEQGGGTVYDLGVYCINAVRHLFGDEPTEVRAATARRAEARFARADEMTTAILHFPNDRVASFTTSFGAARVDTYRVVGTRGDLRMEPAYDYKTHLAYEVRLGEDMRRQRFGVRDQFGPELEYFSRCVLENQAPEPDGEEGLADVRVACAIYQSAFSGQPVALEPRPRLRRPRIEQAMRRPPVDPRQVPIVE